MELTRENLATISSIYDVILEQNLWVNVLDDLDRPDGES